MTMMTAAAAAVAAVLLAVQLKSVKPEFGLYVSLGAVVILFGIAASRMEILLKLLNRIEGYIQWDSVYMTALLKMLGITYLSEFASNICKDAGYQAVAGQIDLVGKLFVLTVSMPILLALLETIDGFLFL